MAVDRDSGILYVCLSDRGGIVSGDQGKTWEKHGKEVGKGRTETPGCLLLDPTSKSKQILMATVYGMPVVTGTTDSGTEWHAMDKKCSHIDWKARSIGPTRSGSS